MRKRLNWLAHTEATNALSRNYANQHFSVFETLLRMPQSLWQFVTSIKQTHNEWEDESGNLNPQNESVHFSASTFTLIIDRLWVELGRRYSSYQDAQRCLVFFFFNTFANIHQRTLALRLPKKYFTDLEEKLCWRSCSVWEVSVQPGSKYICPSTTQVNTKTEFTACIPCITLSPGSDNSLILAWSRLDCAHHVSGETGPSAVNVRWKWHSLGTGLQKINQEF